jgi:hypothetical protein
MKIKIFSAASMAFAGIMACSTMNYAQQAPASPPAKAETPSPNISYGQGTMAYATPAPLTVTVGQDIYVSPYNQNDTTYTKRMQKLQQQMHDLQKQMSDLRSEEFKKTREDNGKRTAENNQNFDRNFSERFKDFGQNMRINIERSDENLEKKVQIGEIKLKTKTYAKSYTVDANDKLQIDNRYGKVTINTWTKNEFKVDVEIKAYANDENDAKELLDQVTINDSKENSTVAFTTVINDGNHRNSFWGTMTSNGKTTVRKTVINYVVYMPAKNSLTVTNKYGSTILPNLNGKLIINNSYGGLTAKSLTNSGNVINVKYGNADIESLVGSDLDVAYGSLNLQSADKLNVDVSYGSAKIGRITTSGTINIKYGGLQINDMDKNLKNLSVNSSYTPVKLGSMSNANADFDVSVHMGGFSYSDNTVNVTSKTPDDNKHGWSSTQTYKGHIGKGSNDKLIIIKANYGSVKFDQ